MEEFFPKHGVRYIALYDNVDTFDGDNEIAPFKNVLNEMYSRDISKKVHASYHLQATKGKFTGVVPPLGYQKDRLETLDRLIAKLYNDLINDKITESVFDNVGEDTERAGRYQKRTFPE